MMCKYFLTWKGAYRHVQSLHLINIQANFISRWYGCEVILTDKEGKLPSSFWKQVWCRHQWIAGYAVKKNPSLLNGVMGHSMNTCYKCGLVRAGPD